MPYDALRAVLDAASADAHAAADAKAPAAPIKVPLFEQRRIEQERADALLPKPGPPVITEVPEFAQPQTVVGAAKVAVREEEAKAQAATVKPYSALTAEITGQTPAPAVDIEVQTPEEVEKILGEVEQNLMSEEERRKGGWVKFEDGWFAGGINALMKVADVGEDVARGIITRWNTVGPDMNVPGQSAEERAIVKDALVKVPALYSEVRRAGLDPSFLHIEASPQGNVVGVADNKTWNTFRAYREMKLRNEILKDTGTFTKENAATVAIEAERYADKALEAALAGPVGRNFPRITREKMPGDTARWLQSYPPAFRLFMTGIWQDNATIMLPNGQVYEQDLQQNTAFGALDYGFSLISPAYKPLAAGAETGRTLTGDDLRKYIRESFTPEPLLYPMIMGLSDTIPDFDSGIPFDLDSEAALQHMMEGKADIVTHHAQLGGALAENLLDAPGVDASLAERGVKNFSKGLMMVTGGNALARHWGWTEAEVLGVAVTGGAVLTEPDGFALMGVVGKGAKLVGGAAKIRKAAKVVKVTEQVLKEVDVATDLAKFPLKLAKGLDPITGGMSAHIIERIYTSRINQLLTEDPDVLDLGVAEARKLKDEVDHLKTTGAAVDAADTERLKTLARYEDVSQKVVVAMQHQRLADIQKTWFMTPGWDAGEGVDAVTTVADIRAAMKDQVAAEHALKVIEHTHGNRLAEFKAAAKRRDDLAQESANIKAEAQTHVGKLEDELTRLGDDLLNAGITPPRNEAEARKLAVTHSDPVAAALIDAYRITRKDVKALRKKYADLIADAATTHNDARQAMRKYKGMVAVQNRKVALQQRLHAAAGEAAKAQGKMDSLWRYNRVKSIEAKHAQAVKAEAAHRAAAKTLRKEVLHSTREVPAAQSRINHLGPKYERYAKQAAREIVEGVRDGHKAITEIADLDYGAADNAVRASTTLAPDGSRVFNGDEFAAELSKIADDTVWKVLRDAEVDIIQRALNGETMLGDEVARLKVALNRAGRITKSGERTPSEMRGLAFWRSMDDPNRPIWGSWPIRTMRTAWRKTVSAFGMDARISEMAPFLGRLATHSARASSRTQQELYEILVDGDVTNVFTYLSSTDGVTTRGGITYMNQGDTSLYHRFLERAQSLADVADNGEDAKLMDEALDVQAVARAFLPDGMEIAGEDGAAIFRAVLRALKARPPKDAKSLYNQLPHIIARTLVKRRGGLEADYRKAAQATRKRASNVAGFSAGIAQGAVMHQVGHEIGSIILGRHSLEDVRAANDLMNGKMGSAADVDAAVRVLSEMEMALNPRGGGKLGNSIRNLVVLSNSKEGAVFAPKVLLDEINQSIDGMVKELDAIHVGERVPPTVNVFIRGMTATLRAVQVGLVRGYIVPRFKRFTNANFQNFSQIWQEEGMPTAMKVAIKSAPSNIAWAMPTAAIKAGARIQAKTADTLGGVPVLGGLLASIASPHSGRIFAGEVGRITLDGREFTYDEIRRLAVEYGVMDNTLRSELGPQLIEIMKRRQGAGKYLPPGHPDTDNWKWLPGKAAEKLADAWRVNSDWTTRAVEVMEQRQRMELFLHLLDKGLDVDQAAKRTINALYDWSSPIAHWETQLVMGRIPFYRVFRNGGQHVVRTLTEPFTAPTADYMVRGLFGQTSLGRSRAQYRLMQMYSQESDHDPNTPGRQTRFDINAAQLVVPGWVNGRTPFKSSLISPENARTVEERLGKRVDQAVILHPELSALQNLDMVGSTAMAIGAITLASLDALGVFVGLKAGENSGALVSDFGERTVEVALDYIGLATPEMLDALGSVFDGDWRATAPISAGEAISLQWLPEPFGPRQNADGTWQANKAARAFARYVPFIGPQWQDVLKAYVDKSVSDDEVGRIYEVVSHLVGASRTYYSYSEDEQNRRAKDTERKLKQAIAPYTDAPYRN